MSQTTITERTELAQELAPLVKSLLAKESKNVADVELVESTDGVSTLPAIYSAGGIKKVVRIATNTLVQETATKADSLVVAATEAANASAIKADKATTDAQEATKQTLEAKTKTEEATIKATTATETANKAAESAFATAKMDFTDMLQRLTPTGLAVSCIKRITVSNPQPVFIKAVLTPTDALQSIIFISDNRACFVTQDGRIRVLSEGVSTIQVIPTYNTALTKTITIEVGKPLARLNTLKSLRLSSDRAFRLT